MTQEPFWMVWREGGSAPTFKHRDENSARQEAARLAMNIGGSFHVLRSVTTATYNTVTWTDHKAPDDGLPF